MSTGIELRDAGTEAAIAADVAAHRGAGKFIEQVIREYADLGVKFTADDIREALRDNPAVVRELASKPNLLPAYIGSASRAHRIRPVDTYRPERASRRANRNLVWVGVH